MDRLSRYVPPYASDYTGVAASLYDLDGMVVFCDAGCCTDHYVLNDEPRWRRRQGLCFSTHLRSTEAVLGSDSDMVDRVCGIAGSVGRELPFVAVLGTPVPGIVGMDMPGVASEIEARLGVPALGFDTAGFRYYDSGVELAARAVFERFAQGAASEGEGGAATEGDEAAGGEATGGTEGSRRSRWTLNILGATPLDFGDVGNEDDFAALFEGAGWEVGLQFPMNARMGDVARVGSARVNVAVSAAGIRVARYLEERFGTPYVAGCPAGPFDGPLDREILEAVEEVAAGRRPSGWWCDGDAENAREATRGTPAGEEGADRPTLVIADQVVGESIRRLLGDAGPQPARGPVLVVSPFSWDARHARPGDFSFRAESELVARFARLHPARLVADPVFEFLCRPAEADCAFAPLTHCAVSGKLHWDDAARLSRL